MSKQAEYRDLQDRFKRGEISADEFWNAKELLVQRPGHGDDAKVPVIAGIEMPFWNRGFWLIVVVCEGLFWIPLVVGTQLAIEPDRARAAATLSYLLMCVGISLGTAPLFGRVSGDAWKRYSRWGHAAGLLRGVVSCPFADPPPPSHSGRWLVEHRMLPYLWLVCSVQIYPAAWLRESIASEGRLLLATPLIAIPLWIYSAYRSSRQWRHPMGRVEFTPRDPMAGENIEGYIWVGWVRVCPKHMELNVVRLVETGGNNAGNGEVRCPAEIYETTWEFNQAFARFRMASPPGLMIEGSWQFECRVDVGKGMMPMIAPIPGTTTESARDS